MNDEKDKAPTRLLLSTFDMCHRQKFGVPAYLVGGKHAAILARIWKLYGTDRLVTLIQKFFEGNDFANEAGYSIEVFASQVPRLLMQIERAKMATEKVQRLEWADNWAAECVERHGGKCGNRHMHQAQMHADRERESA